MAVDYEEGRRLLKAKRDLEAKIAATQPLTRTRDCMNDLNARDRLVEFLLTHAEALLTPWRPISELPEEWKDGRRLLLAFWLHNKPDTEYCVVTASWVQGEGWMIDEETQWYPFPPTHFRPIEPPGGEG